MGGDIAIPKMRDLHQLPAIRQRDFPQWLASRLRASFGTGSVFIDTRSIRGGDVWAAEIEQSLRSAKAVVAVIGKHWLTTSDEFGRRRIDLPDDWVRREIELSLREGKNLLPL